MGHACRPPFWTSWGHLLAVARNGEPAFRELHGTTVWEYLAAHPEEGATFGAAMTALSAGVVEAVVQSYDFSGPASSSTWEEARAPSSRRS